MSRIEVLTVGDELVEGRLADGNSAVISSLLADAGLGVTRHTSVGDDLDELVAVLREAAVRCSAVIVTGGLGPTSDDLTAAAAAAAFARPLERYPEALRHVREFFALRGRRMSPNNEKQADLPGGSELLANPEGTALGFHLEHAGCRFFFLPGVPREMEPMVVAEVLPRLVRYAAPSPPVVASLKTFGAGESRIAELLEGLEEDVPAGVRLTVQYRASFPEIHVRLVVWPPPGDDGGAALGALRERAERRLERYVYAVGGASVPTTFAEAVLAAARAVGASVATAESCTGGLVGGMLTAVAGSSDVYLGGAVSYAYSAKEELLGVPTELLARHGAVSAEVAAAMAEGIRSRLSATHAVSVTGIAGPAGGSPEKPVGTVWIGVAASRDTTTRCFHFPYDRERVRVLSAYAALRLLWRSFTDDGGDD